MKRAILAIAVFCSLIAVQRTYASEDLTAQIAAAAQTEEPKEWPLSLSLSTGYKSRFILPNGDSCHNDSWTSEAIASVSRGPLSGAYFGLWNSIGLDDTNLRSNFGDEVDGTVGFSKDWLDAGLTYWKCYDSKWDVWYPYINLSKAYEVWKGHSLSPYLGFAFPIPAKGDDNGVYTFFGVKHTFSPAPKTSFNHKIGFIYDDGALGYDELMLFNYELSLGYEINKNLSWRVVELRVVSPLESADDNREGKIAVGTSIALLLP